MKIQTHLLAHFKIKSTGQVIVAYCNSVEIKVPYYLLLMPSISSTYQNEVAYNKAEYELLSVSYEPS